MSPPDTWVAKGGAVLRVLNKIDSTVQELTLKAGETQQVQSLSLSVEGCFVRPGRFAAGCHGAFEDRRHAAGHAGVRWLDPQERAVPEHARAPCLRRATRGLRVNGPHRRRSGTVGITGGSAGMNVSLPPPDRAAFLLDLDGTLLDIAPTPNAVVVAPGLLDSLRGRCVSGAGERWAW